MTEREDGVRNEPVSIVFEEKAQRSAAYQDGRLIGECEFSASETVWIITHTGVRSGHEGQGIARKLVEKVIGEARVRHVRILPICSYARKLMIGNDAYQDVL